MSIIRVDHNRENPYIQINKEAINDPDLDFDEVGLWTRILGLKDQSNIRTDGLAKAFRCSQDKILRLINNLIEKGYATRNAIKNERGQIERWDYTIYEFRLPEEMRQKRKVKGQDASSANQDASDIDFKEMFPDRRNPDLVFCGPYQSFKNESKNINITPIIPQSHLEESFPKHERATPQDPDLNENGNDFFSMGDNEEARRKYLEGIELPNDEKIPEKMLCFWIKHFSLWKIMKCTDHVERAVLSGKCKNPMGLFYMKLNDRKMDSTKEIEITRKKLKSYLQRNNLNLKMNDEFLILSNSKELPLKLGHQMIIDQIERMNGEF